MLPGCWSHAEQTPGLGQRGPICLGILFCHRQKTADPPPPGIILQTAGGGLRLWLQLYSEEITMIMSSGWCKTLQGPSLHMNSEILTPHFSNLVLFLTSFDKWGNNGSEGDVTAKVTHLKKDGMRSLILHLLSPKFMFFQLRMMIKKVWKSIRKMNPDNFIVISIPFYECAM